MQDIEGVAQSNELREDTENVLYGIVLQLCYVIASGTV